MTALTGPDKPPTFDVGDRVVALHDIGGIFRAHVRRGEYGIVVARRGRGELEVHFANGRRELTTADTLAHVPLGR